MKAIRIPVTVDLPRKRIEDIMCCALEGGSTYWCSSCVPSRYPDGAKYASEAIARLSQFEIHYDDGDGEESVKEIQPTDERFGEILAEIAGSYPKHWEWIISENEDADTGDLFFQLLCFGEVVYG